MASLAANFGSESVAVIDTTSDWPAGSTSIFPAISPGDTVPPSAFAVLADTTSSEASFAFVAASRFGSFDGANTVEPKSF